MDLKNAFSKLMDLSDTFLQVDGPLVHFTLYFLWVDGMFCVTPGVEVSLHMWVYVISIMGV
jgi:hypothetical protein